MSKEHSESTAISNEALKQISQACSWPLSSLLKTTFNINNGVGSDLYSSGCKTIKRWARMVWLVRWILVIFSFAFILIPFLPTLRVWLNYRNIVETKLKILDPIKESKQKPQASSLYKELSMDGAKRSETVGDAIETSTDPGNKLVTREEIEGCMREVREQADEKLECLREDIMKEFKDQRTKERTDIETQSEARRSNIQRFTGVIEGRNVIDQGLSASAIGAKNYDSSV